MAEQMKYGSIKVVVKQYLPGAAVTNLGEVPTVMSQRADFLDCLSAKSEKKL